MDVKNTQRGKKEIKNVADIENERTFVITKKEENQREDRCIHHVKKEEYLMEIREN